MPERPFVHLHCHTHYSLLDGASRIPELVELTKSLLSRVETEHDTCSLLCDEPAGGGRPGNGRSGGRIAGADVLGECACNDLVQVHRRVQVHPRRG